MSDDIEIIKHQKEKSDRGDFLKLTGALAMTFDHIAFVFFPHLLAMRLVGRLALPVFSAGVAKGYQYTSNLRAYFLRLIILAIISQIPYYLLFGWIDLNIVFTLALSLGLIYSLEKKKYFLAPLIILAPILLEIDYGIYGVAMAGFFYFFRQSKVLLLIFLSVLTLIFSWFEMNPIQPFAILGFYFVLYFPKNLIKIKLPKYFFYWFYPGHLAVLYLIKLIWQ